MRQLRRRRRVLYKSKRMENRIVVGVLIGTGLFSSERARMSVATVVSDEMSRVRRTRKDIEFEG